MQFQKAVRKFFLTTLFASLSLPAGSMAEGPSDPVLSGGETGSSGTCSCPLTKPDSNWCTGQPVLTCADGTCYKANAASANCGANFKGAYCGCLVTTPTDVFVAPPISISEQMCVSVGQFIVKKLFKKLPTDPAAGGYDVEACVFTP